MYLLFYLFFINFSFFLNVLFDFHNIFISKILNTNLFIIYKYNSTIVNLKKIQKILMYLPRHLLRLIVYILLQVYFLVHFWYFFHSLINNH